MNTNLRFSDYWWIDLPCFMIFFILLMGASLKTLIDVELSIYYVVNYDPFLSDLIAPIVEESFKFLMLSLWIPLGVGFTAIFSILEGFQYVSYAINHFGDLNATFFITRTICIGVHFLTLACQIFGFRMYYKYKMWIYLILGYVSAIFIHFEWNVEAGRYVVYSVRYICYITTKLLGT